MIITGSVSRNDKEQIRTILETSGFFYPFEVSVVMELIDETTKSDEKNSGYYWLKIVGSVLACRQPFHEKQRLRYPLSAARRRESESIWGGLVLD